MNLPREHGAWGILLIPFATAAGIAGVFDVKVALLLASVLSFYLARTSFLKGDYRWMIGLLALSVVAAVPVVVVWHRWWLVAFGAGVAPVALRRTDRGVALQLAAVAGLTLTAPIAWYVATGSLGGPAWRLWLLNALYFAGRMFYVKMHITAAIQRGASRLRLGAPTLAYHGALAGVVIGWWPVGLAFAPSVIHAFIGVARLTPVLRITDPATWGKNFPRQYDGYRRTSERTGTEYGGGGSDTLATDKLKADPRLVTIFDGYAFAIDYRARRGHAYMLDDQRMTKRVTQKPQPGSCLHCHAANTMAYRKAGLENGAPGTLDDPLLSATGYAQLQTGFEKICALSYSNATQLVEHPVACVDCHDPDSLQLRVTRPGFLNGIRALAASADPVPHLPSIEKWRLGDRQSPYDPNQLATRQEMRSFVCGQCHVEYYCGPKTTLFYPWNNGLKVEQIEAFYDSYKFPDGHRFYDWKHATTGAEVLKAQHPEFEMWSQGIHARSGVACADCHMPYRREGAIKISDHWVRSPLLNVANACQVCHHFPEDEIRDRVALIQDRNHALLSRAEDALVALIQAIGGAMKGGATDVQLAPARALQRKAQWRVDFINAENSMGFHAPQEAARILAEAIDYAREGEIAVLKIRSR